MGGSALAGQPGFFDGDERLKVLSAAGDPLEGLAQVVDFEVFRDDLERNPRNPRSLFGLEQALKSQGRTYDATFVRKQFDASWKGPAAGLKVDDLV